MSQDPGHLREGRLGSHCVGRGEVAPFCPVGGRVTVWVPPARASARALSFPCQPSCCLFFRKRWGPFCPKIPGTLMPPSELLEAETPSRVAPVGPRSQHRPAGRKALDEPQLPPRGASSGRPRWPSLCLHCRASVATHVTRPRSGRVPSGGAAGMTAGWRPGPADGAHLVGRGNAPPPRPSWTPALWMRMSPRPRPVQGRRAGRGRKSRGFVDFRARRLGFNCL